MYDYLGGDQVKCFYIPIVYVEKGYLNAIGDTFAISASGGCLRGYGRGSKVPVKTEFYTYGNDFMVFDFRGFSYEDKILVHIIKDGRYKRSVDFKHIPSRYKIGLVVDNYGSPLNIHSKEDFVKIYDDFKTYHQKYIDLSRESNEKMNEVIRLHREKKIDPKEVERILEEVRVQNDLSFDNSLKIFNDLWRLQEDNRGWVIGGIISCFSMDYKKELVIKLFLNTLEKENKTLNSVLTDYFCWCDENEVPYDQSEIENLFNVYSQEMPESIKYEYELSKEKK